MGTMRASREWAYAISLAAIAIVALIGSPANAQSGWGRDTSSDLSEQKEPPAPPLQIAGYWSGTIQDPEQGTGDLSVFFTQKSSKTKSPLKGTWTIHFTTGPSGEFIDIGTIAGSVTASSVAITMRSVKGDRLMGALVFTSSEATEQSISGNFHFPADKNHKGPVSIQPSAAPATVYVNVGENFFAPNQLMIGAGQTVRWVNRGGAQHSVDSNDSSGKCKPFSTEVFHSGTLNPGANPDNRRGDSFDHTFDNPGTFAYHSGLNGCSMKGTITVE
jgi:plastocyanin